MTTSVERSKIRRYVKRVLARRKWWGYQFRQPAHTTTLTAGGSVGCFDTSVQIIYRLAKKKVITQNQVRRATGARPDAPTPASSALGGLRRLGLPYTIRTGLSTREVANIVMNKGPVVIAYRYWSHPHWKGARYFGRPMNGWTTDNAGRRKFVGFSSPAGASGSNQFGFRGGHAAVIAWARETEDGDFVFGVRDPNHNSALRPERPMWDKITSKQLRVMMDSIRPDYGGQTLIMAPVRRVIDG